MTTRDVQDLDSLIGEPFALERLAVARDFTIEQGLSLLGARSLFKTRRASPEPQVAVLVDSKSRI